MFRFLSVVLFLAHFLLLRTGNPKVRWLLPLLVGVPSAVMLLSYALVGSEENRDVLYVIPIFAMGPIILAELFSAGFAFYRRLKTKNQ
jgi:hypothetical protein